jgi:glutamyl-tRNA synthetase
LVDAEAERLSAAVDLHRSRARTLPEVVAMIAPYFSERVTYEPGAEKHRADAAAASLLAALAERWRDVPEWTKERLEESLRAFAAERGVKAGALIHPVRMATTGVAVGPPLFDVVALMGRDAALRHLAAFLDFLSAPREA